MSLMEWRGSKLNHPIGWAEPGFPPRSPYDHRTPSPYPSDQNRQSGCMKRPYHSDIDIDLDLDIDIFDIDI